MTDIPDALTDDLWGWCQSTGADFAKLLEQTMTDEYADDLHAGRLIIGLRFVNGMPALYRMMDSGNGG